MLLRIIHTSVCMCFKKFQVGKNLGALPLRSFYFHRKDSFSLAFDRDHVRNEILCVSMGRRQTFASSEESTSLIPQVSTSG